MYGIGMQWVVLFVFILHRRVEFSHLKRLYFLLKKELFCFLELLFV